MKDKSITIVILFMTLNSCASFTPTKKVAKLNLTNIKITSIYSSAKTVKGAFCTKHKLTTITDNSSLPPVGLYILKDPSKSSTEYFETISGSVLLYETKNKSKILNEKEMQDFINSKSECGINNAYPYIYSFDLPLNISDSTKNEFFKEREAILEQIKQNHYVSIVAVQPPYMSVVKPTLISSQPAKLFFSNEQLVKLKLPDKSNQPVNH